MTKEEILNQLRKSKALHTGWVQRAKLVMEGFTINETSYPIISTECHFGVWFYTDGQKLNHLRNNSRENMETIESLHTLFHETYANLYQLYYETEKKGFFSKKIGSKKKVTEENIALAQQYYETMEEILKKFSDNITIVERRISVISDAEIATL